MRDWLRKASFRTRVSALAAAAVGLTVAVAALVSYLVVANQLYNQVDTQLGNEVRIATSVRPDGTVNIREASSLLARLSHQDLLQLVGPGGLYYPVPGTAPVTLPVNSGDMAVAASRSTDSTLTTRSVDGTTYRVITVGGQLQASDGTPLALQIAHPLADIMRTLRELRLVLFVVALGGVAVAVVLGYVVALGTIRPVERLTAAAEHVAATQDLDAHIEDGGGDELGRLAQAFNAMLGALRASRRQQAQLVSDAGHELRTPLTSLRTNIEVLLRVQDLPPADRTELLHDVRGQLEELTTLIGDIVELARQDEQQAEPSEVRFDAVVERALERARRRAQGVGFDVRMDAGMVVAQPALLERAVLNVLDNAVKFSPPGGRVEVTLTRAERWVLDVADHGPGIAPTDLPHVFDRFYRAETARSLPGSGLGLAIVAQVVRGLGGVVQALAPPAGGTLIRIELPIVSESEAGPPEPGPGDEGTPAGEVPSVDETVPSGSLH